METLNINYNEIDFDISYKKRDGKETILFLHGLGASKNNFRRVWDHVALSEYGIVTFDFPGFGNSSKPENFSYSIEDQAEITKLIIEKLNLKKVHLVGHSMGGSISVLVANDDRVISFTSFEGNMIGKDCSLSRIISELSFNELQKRQDLYGRNNINVMYKSSLEIIRLADTGKLFDMFLELELKKSYFYGEKYEMASTKLLDGKVNLVKISNSGHFLMRDNPNELYNKLVDVI